MNEGKEQKPMKILVIGGGGREHTIVWKLSQSPQVDTLYAAPGNAGIAESAECLPVSPTDKEALAVFAVEKGIDLTVVGPEAPLVEGIVNFFTSKGLRIFGFDSGGARLEGSKVWAKNFMKRHGVPTGDFSVFDKPGDAIAAIEAGSPPFVVKADGLAAGKGVLICDSVEEGRAAVEKVMMEMAFGSAGSMIVLEEFLTGREISILAVFDGKDYRLFVPSQDHKRAYDGDTGPNTGGMGAYAPVPFVDSELFERIRRVIIEPTFTGMLSDGIAGSGVLYFGIIDTDEGPKVLEYNCRFGDPETQVILPLFEGDLAEVMLEATMQNLEGVSFSNSGQSAACVVVASGGYPGSYKKGCAVEGLEEAARRGCILFHAGTERKDGALQTSGGRVLGVTAVAGTLREAIETAYRGVEAVHFADCFSRRDIGKMGLLGA
jgi:phosphoribosylamine--glycine ligase